MKSADFGFRCHRTLLPLALIWAIVGGSAAAHATATYHFELDTSSLSGQPGNFLAFDLVAGDTVSPNNQVQAFNLQTDGTLSDSSSLNLQDTAFFNEELREITFGTFLKFDLSLSENNAPPGVDQFSFFVLDSGLLPLIQTSDPTGSDALFAIDLSNTPGGLLSRFTSQSPGFSWRVTLEPVPVPVPDTGGMSLVLWTLACLAAAKALRGRR